jgi:hypothetical protein
MGTYIVIDDSEPHEVATNSAWRALTDYTAGFREHYAELASFFAHGITEDAPAVVEQLRAAVEEFPPDYATLSAAESTMDYIADTPRGAVVMATNGVTIIDEDEDEDDEDEDEDDEDDESLQFAEKKRARARPAGSVEGPAREVVQASLAKARRRIAELLKKKGRRRSPK